MDSPYNLKRFKSRFKSRNHFQKLQISSKRLATCLAFAIILISRHMSYFPKISSFGIHSSKQKRITLRPQSDLLEILQNILPLESPTQHSGNKYLKTRKISELVTKHRQVPLLSTMLKQQDHDTDKADYHSYEIICINKLQKLDNTPIK